MVIYLISCWSSAPSCYRKTSSETLYNFKIRAYPCNPWSITILPPFASFASFARVYSKILCILCIHVPFPILPSFGFYLSYFLLERSSILLPEGIKRSVVKLFLCFMCFLWLKRSRHKAAPTVLPHPWLKCRMDRIRNWKRGGINHRVLGEHRDLETRMVCFCVLCVLLRLIESSGFFKQRSFQSLGPAAPEQDRCASRRFKNCFQPDGSGARYC